MGNMIRSVDQFVGSPPMQPLPTTITVI